MARPKRVSRCELGPIRPPSEATSLLLRVTRNCPWNKCAFCAVYKRDRFGRRPEEDVMAEIDLLAEAAGRVRRRAARDGDGDVPSSHTVLDIIHDPASTDEERRCALWLHRGGEHVFLQDADSLVIRPERVCRVLRHLYDRFPSVSRVTTYARTRTLAVRTPEQLASLREAGLTRIHVGVESGSDAVLEAISKGCRGEHHVEGCRRVIDAGFELCCYVMPGLGGAALTREHARDTAAVLREIDPHHVRLRTLWIDPGSPLWDMHREGAFTLLEEDDVVAEIRDVLRGLVGARGSVISDHDRNLLGDLEGHLTDDAEALEGMCDRFLDLPAGMRAAFVVARRSGYFRSLDAFLADPVAPARFAPIAAELRDMGEGSLALGLARGSYRRSI